MVISMLHDPRANITHLKVLRPNDTQIVYAQHKTYCVENV